MDVIGFIDELIGPIDELIGLIDELIGPIELIGVIVTFLNCSLACLISSVDTPVVDRRVSLILLA